MASFGVETDEEVSDINKEILETLRDKERDAAARRKAKGRGVMGARKLRQQPIMKDHEPKKRSRKIFVLASTLLLRKLVIREFREFCNRCRECYQKWLEGDFTVVWPPGAFKPPFPPNANLLP